MSATIHRIYSRNHADTVVVSALMRSFLVPTTYAKSIYIATADEVTGVLAQPYTVDLWLWLMIFCVVMHGPLLEMGTVFFGGQPHRSPKVPLGCT